jgi:hypothetical protein
MALLRLQNGVKGVKSCERGFFTNEKVCEKRFWRMDFHGLCFSRVVKKRVKLREKRVKFFTGAYFFV